MYDGAKLVLTKDGNGNTQVRYTTQGPAPYSDVISQRQNNQTYYYMLDGIHNVYQVVDSLLAIRNTYDYDWFRYMTQRNEEIRNDYHVSLWTTLYLDYSLYQAEQLCYQALYGRNIQMPFNNARFTSLLYPEFVARDAVLSPTSMPPTGGERAYSYLDCSTIYEACRNEALGRSSFRWIDVGAGALCTGSGMLGLGVDACGKGFTEAERGQGYSPWLKYVQWGFRAVSAGLTIEGIGQLGEAYGCYRMQQVQLESCKTARDWCFAACDRAAERGVPIDDDNLRGLYY